MRKYILPEWKYAVETTKALSRKKKYAERFRHDYFVLIGTKKDLKSRFKSSLFNILVYFNHMRYIITRQLFKSNNSILDAKYNFFLENNPSYLKTVMPVAQRLIQNGEQVKIFCPVYHYELLVKSLKPELANVLFILEDAKIANSKIKALGLIVRAVFMSLFDGFWFMTKPIAGRFFFATDFMKFGLTHYCYNNYWHGYFDNKKRYLIAANEFHYWESLLFTICRDTISHSIILAHGRETEISYPIFAKKRFTWGSHDVDLLVNTFKADPSEVEAVGSPYFDRIYSEIQSRKKVHPSSNRVLIAFYGQPFYKVLSEGAGEYHQAVEWFFHLAKSLPSEKFMIKLHPFDDIEYYRRAPENVIFSNENILLSLEKCKIILTVDSNSILEAAVFGIPAIQCIPSGCKIFNDYSNSGVSIRVSNEMELSKLILQLNSDSQFYNEIIHKSELALKEYFANLGHSLDTIIERIKD